MTESFISFCKKLEKERHDALADTFEAKLVEAIEAMEAQVFDGKLDAEKITETINAGKPERFRKTQNTVTRTLKGMGFKAKRSHGITWIEIDSSLLTKLRARYGDSSVPEGTHDKEEMYPVSDGNDEKRTEGTEGTENQGGYAPPPTHTLPDDDKAYF